MSNNIAMSVAPQKGSHVSFYFFGLILYILLFLSYETKWEYPVTIRGVMRVFIILSLIMSFVLVFFKYRDIKELLLILCCLVVTFVVGYNASFQKGHNLLFNTVVTFLLVFGAKGIEFRKIVRVYVIVGGLYCSISVIASLIGFIPNSTDFSLGREDAVGTFDNLYRMCLGYNVSTNMANHVFFIFLSYFYLINRVMKKRELLIFATITLLTLYYTGSRLSTYCVILVLLFTIVYKKQWGKSFFGKKRVTYILIFFIPILTIFSYYVSVSYDDSNIYWIGADALFSHRLHLSHDALQSFGIPIMGQFYEMFSSSRNDGMAYNYLDNSFIQLLVIYGLIYTALINIAYVFICKKAVSHKNMFLLYSVFFAGVSGLVAQHFIEMYMNPFLIALFASHNPES